LPSLQRADQTIAAPADDLCLAYANTLYWRGSPQPTETLHRLEDLLAWASETCGMPADVVRRCRRRCQGNADEAFNEAIALRERIHDLFAALAAGEVLPAPALAVFNVVLLAAPARSQLRLKRNALVWALPDTEPGIPLLLAPVLWSAGDLVTGPRANRVRCCANDRCRWLFLDNSKNASRRWCAMSACGNRAKAQRHYLRQRHIGGEEGLGQA
jgi:predicted RNA-binding Zn ribbon-like protein